LNGLEILSRRDLRGPLAVFSAFLVLFGLLAVFSDGSRRAQAELNRAEALVRELEVGWASWKAEAQVGGPGAPALEARCAQTLDQLLASKVWGPMEALRRLSPGLRAEVGAEWGRAVEAGGAGASPGALERLGRELEDFATRQESVDGLLQQLLWASVLAILVASVGLWWAQDRQGQMARQIQAVHRDSLVALEAERRALSRELHDTVAQDLAAVKLQLSLVQLPGPVADRVREDLDRALAQVRQMAVDLRPPALESVGLVPALRELCAHQARRSGMQVTCDLAAAADLSFREPTAVHLYRIVQEALQNAVRHSRGRSVHVALRPVGALVRLDILDDGLGMDRAPAAGSPGRTALGLVGMRERAGLIGGQLNVESATGSGTRISLEVNP